MNHHLGMTLVEWGNKSSFCLNTGKITMFKLKTGNLNKENKKNTVIPLLRHDSLVELINNKKNIPSGNSVCSNNRSTKMFWIWYQCLRQMHYATYIISVFIWGMQYSLQDPDDQNIIALWAHASINPLFSNISGNHLQTKFLSNIAKLRNTEHVYWLKAVATMYNNSLMLTDNNMVIQICIWKAQKLHANK